MEDLELESEQWFDVMQHAYEDENSICHIKYWNELAYNRLKDIYNW